MMPASTNSCRRAAPSWCRARRAGLPVLRPAAQPRRSAAFTFYEAYVDEAAFHAHLHTPHVAASQRTALPHIDTTSIAMPDSVGVPDDGV
ncbi:MAG: hypothetical protein FJ137_21025 [Deltaproteobacteria bacterium]|nr:hypothetical protein [Deltaproteobacteria bacterium]